MATGPRPPSGGPPREDETSIKARKQLLFEEEDDGAGRAAAEPVRPFVEYLRTTPAAPLSMGVKALLWAVGVVVVLLFLAAILKAR